MSQKEQLKELYNALFYKQVDFSLLVDSWNDYFPQINQL